MVLRGIQCLNSKKLSVVLFLSELLKLLVVSVQILTYFNSNVIFFIILSW